METDFGKPETPALSETDAESGHAEPDTVALGSPAEDDTPVVQPVTSQLWFILLISFIATLLLAAIIIMGYCVYRRRAAKHRASFIDTIEPHSSYGSTAVDVQLADANNNADRTADQSQTQSQSQMSMNGTRHRALITQLQPSSIAYPDVHIEVTLPLQVQPTAQQLAEEDGALLEVDAEAEAEAEADTQCNRDLAPIEESVPPVINRKPLYRERYRVPNAVHSALEPVASSASCSSTPAASHRACSPTQSLPTSTTGSSSSGVPNSIGSTNAAGSSKRSRLKGLFESRRGSSASLTISLTPTSSTALSSLPGGTEEVGTQVPVNAAPADAHLQIGVAHSTTGSDRMLLESIVAAKTRQPLPLPSLIARMQQNVPAIHDEFWSIPMNHFQKVTVPGASIKNRYRTILPNEHSRVTLQPPFHPRTVSLSSPAPSPSAHSVAPRQDAAANEEVDPLCIYINANYVRAYLPSVDRANRTAQAVASRAFIATQGPLPNTLVDFWRMCWYERTPCIVMITRLMEKSKTKCEPYLPPVNTSSGNGNGNGYSNGAATPASASSPTATASIGALSSTFVAAGPPAIVTQSFGDVHVSVLSLQVKDGYEVRDVLLRCDNETHAVKHYWFTAWPDNKTPSTAKQLIQMILEIRAHRDKQAAILQRIRQRHGYGSQRASTSEAYSSSAAAATSTTNQTLASGANLQNAGGDQQSVVLGPTIVHCSAGLGRTGCFIAICNAMQQYEAEQAVDILGIVAQMRLDRGGLIQTNEQYEFVYRAICEYATTHSIRNQNQNQSPVSSNRKLPVTSAE